MNRTYDYATYWLNEGKKPVEIKPWFSDQVKNLHSVLDDLKFESVLEIGCGEGRITKMMLENYRIKEYDAVDISSHRIEKARNNLKKYPWVKFTQTSFQNFISDKKYDLVIAVEVLMHVPDDEIEFFVNDMVKRSKKYVVNLDYFPQQGFEWPEMKDQNFQHDYSEKYRNNNIKPDNIAVKTITGQQAIICASKIDKPISGDLPINTINENGREMMDIDSVTMDHDVGGIK